MITCSYFTAGKYEELNCGLVASVAAVGLSVESERIDDRGSWLGNIAEKPRLILRKLEEHPGEDILYVDADTLFHARPSLFLDWKSDCDAAVYFDSPSRCWGGVTFVRAGPGGRRLVEDWLEEARLDPAGQDDDHQLRAWTRPANKPRVLRLAPAYFWVERYMRGRFPGVSPVIEQLAIGEHA